MIYSNSLSFFAYPPWIKIAKLANSYVSTWSVHLLWKRNKKQKHRHLMQTLISLKSWKIFVCVCVCVIFLQRTSNSLWQHGSLCWKVSLPWIRSFRQTPGMSELTLSLGRENCVSKPAVPRLPEERQHCGKGQWRVKAAACSEVWGTEMTIVNRFLIPNASGLQRKWSRVRNGFKEWEVFPEVISSI